MARSSPKKATGLDGVSVADFKALTQQAPASIAGLFHDILLTATFPEPWLNIRVSLVPKKGGEHALKDLRPLSIGPVAYSIWAKTLLVLCSHASSNIHPPLLEGSRRGRLNMPSFKLLLLLKNLPLKRSRLWG